MSTLSTALEVGIQYVDVADCGGRVLRETDSMQGEQVVASVDRLARSLIPGLCDTVHTIRRSAFELGAGHRLSSGDTLQGPGAEDTASARGISIALRRTLTRRTWRFRLHFPILPPRVVTCAGSPVRVDLVSMKWSLAVPRAYSLDAVVESHGWIQLDPFRRLEPSGLSCIIKPPRGRPIEVSVRQPRRSLTVTAARELSRQQKQFVNSRLNWMLGLDQDLAPFYEVARREPSLSHAETKGYGRLLRSPSLFEDVVKTILTTNTTWAGTQRMVSRLVEVLGTPVPGISLRAAFPAPEQVAGAPVETLRKNIGLGYRAPYVSELATRVSSGELDLDSYCHSDLSTAELRRELMAIKGVGPYAAATLLMLVGRYDFLPVDSWALKLVSTEFHDGGPVGNAEVQAAFERWGEWKGLAYWFWDWELLRQLRGDN